MTKKVSMQHIADRLGVSKYTVSQALSGKPGVSHGVRLQIIEMARTLGYRLPSASQPADESHPLNASAQSGTAAPDPSSCILEANSSHAATAAAEGVPGATSASAAAVTPPPTSAAPRLLIYMEPSYMEEPDFWRRVLDGLLAACRDGGSVPAFLEHAPDDASPLYEAEAAHAAGLIVVGKTPSPKLLSLRQLRLPMVLIDHEEPLVDADVILNANLAAARMACNHLLAQGCATIVFVGRDSYAVSFKERWWGCRLAVDEWRASHRDATLQLKKWTLPYGSPAWKQQLAKRLETLEEAGEALPEGFLCANDEMALQLVEALQAKGIEVPGRCRVVGIDNITRSASGSPALTTVELAKEALGRRAVQALEHKLRYRGAPSEKIILSARLIVRQSG